MSFLCPSLIKGAVRQKSSALHTAPPIFQFQFRFLNFYPWNTAKALACRKLWSSWNTNTYCIPGKMYGFTDFENSVRTIGPNYFRISFMQSVKLSTIFSQKNKSQTQSQWNRSQIVMIPKLAQCDTEAARTSSKTWLLLLVSSAHTGWAHNQICWPAHTNSQKTLFEWHFSLEICYFTSDMWSIWSEPPIISIFMHSMLWHSKVFLKCVQIPNNSFSRNTFACGSGHTNEHLPRIPFIPSI